MKLVFVFYLQVIYPPLVASQWSVYWPFHFHNTNQLHQHKHFTYFRLITDWEWNEESSWWLKKTYKSVTLKVVLLRNNISNEKIFLSYKIPWAQQPAGINNKNDATFRELIHLLVFFWSRKISSISQPVNGAWWKPRLCAMTLSGN